MKNKEFQRKNSIYTPSNIPFRIGYQIYFILVGACCFSLSLSSFIIYETGMDYYEFIIENWKKEPLVSVRMVLNQGCEENEEELANYDWPGTNNGCDCPYKSLAVGSCSLNETRRGCRKVGDIDGETFHFPDVKNTSWFQICATRAKNQSFYYNLPRKNECAEGQIKCGEEEDYFYCTNEQVCPILKIAIKEIASLDNQIEATSLESQTLIYTRQMERQLPVVQFRVSEAGVCMRNDERGMSSGRSDYVLMKTKKVDCATDPRFEQIIKTDEFNFYKINRKTNLPEYLPDYDIDSQYEWALYQRSYILWKMKCRGEEYDFFLDQQIYLNDILDNQRDLLIISIVFLSVISIGFSIVSFVNINGYDWPCIKGKGTEESNYIFMIEVLCKLIVQTAQAVIIIKSFAQIKKETDYLQNVVDLDCSDEFVKSQLIDLKRVLEENVYSFNLGLLIIFAITSLLDFGVVIYLSVNFFSRRIKSSNKKQQYEMNPVTGGNNLYQDNQPVYNYPNNNDQQDQQNLNNNGFQNYPQYQQPFQNQNIYQNYQNQQPFNQQNNYGFQNYSDNQQQQGPINYGA